MHKEPLASDVYLSLIAVVSFDLVDNSETSGRIVVKASDLATFLFYSHLVFLGGVLSAKEALVPPPDEATRNEIEAKLDRAFPVDQADRLEQLSGFAFRVDVQKDQKYVALFKVKEVALHQGHAQRLLQSIDTLSAEYAIDTWQAYSTTLEDFARAHPETFLTSELLDKSFTLANQHANEGSAAEAIDFLGHLRDAAKSHLPAKEQQQKLSDIIESLQQRARQDQHYQKAQQRIAVDANDGGAHYTIGAWLIVRQNDWPSALQSFAKCSNEGLAAAASKELAKAGSLEIADAWYELVNRQSVPDVLQTQVVSHAIDWYKKVQDSADGVLDRNIAAQAIEKLKLLQTTNASLPTAAKRSPGKSDGPFSGRAGATRQSLLDAHGGTKQTEKAVELGLSWLSRHQEPAGNWSLRGPYSDGAAAENRAGATAMALLAFLGHGQTHQPQSGADFDKVAKGLQFLIKLQDRAGAFAEAGSAEGAAAYSQALSTIAICEAYAMTRDPLLEAPAGAAIEYATWAQSKQGGWRYKPQTDADTSLTVWFVTALKSGSNAGINVDANVFSHASRYLDTVQLEGGATYRYQASSPPSASMTAAGLWCRLNLGWSRNNKLIQGTTVRFLAADNIFNVDNKNVYYWYYATNLLREVGGSDWRKWNEIMRDQLPKLQIQVGSDAGSWPPAKDQWGKSRGRLFTTCFSVYCLESYYRNSLP